MKLSNKQQKFVRGKAQQIKSTIQIGKNELGDANYETIANALEANELIKVHLLSNAIVSREEAVELLKENITIDYIYTIGNQIVVFKQANDKEKRKLSLDVLAIK